MALTVCKAGNPECGLRKGTSVLLNRMRALPCDVCCSEPGFCPECKCILCSGTISSGASGSESIQCLQYIGSGVCGHSAHLECALECKMAGVVPECGLDIEYLCRRCDKKMDLLPRATLIMKSVAAAPTREIAEKRTSFVLRLIQGTNRNPDFRQGENGEAEKVDNADGPVLQQGDGDDPNGFFECRTSLFNEGAEDATGKELVIDPDEPMDVDEGRATITLCTISKAVSSNAEEEEDEEEEEFVDQTNAIITPEQLVVRYQFEIDRALQQLTKAQELEYAAAKQKLTEQMDRVLTQYEHLESSRFELARPSPNALESFMEKMQQHLDKLKKERAMFDCMLQVGQGFGACSRDLLRRAFNWPSR